MIKLLDFQYHKAIILSQLRVKEEGREGRGGHCNSQKARNDNAFR